MVCCYLPLIIWKGEYASMKVAIYCRLSEEDRYKKQETDDSESIQNQKSILISYALKKDWEIYNIYSDDDYTGSDRSRPQFKQILEDAKLHKFDIILCKSQSRFTRELELVEKYIHGLFPLWNIRFVSIVDNADTENKGNKKARQINGLINEWFLEDLSENIKSVLDDKRENGKHIGSFALYGYIKDPDQKGHLLIDEDAAEIVREVFTLFSKGMGKTNIARTLNDRGIPNPTEYKRLQGLRYSQATTRQSTLWSYSAIASMLKNEIYIGNMVQARYGSISYKIKKNRPRPQEEWIIVNNTHEPIIDKELWDAVQKLIGQRAKPFITGEIGLFSRKAKCLCCGYCMRSTKTKDRYYLKCSQRTFSKEACEGSFISVKKLEQTVIAEINKMSAIYLDKNELERKLNLDQGLTNKMNKMKKELHNYTKKIQEYEKGISELYMDKVKGIISGDEYTILSKNFLKEKEKFVLLKTQAEKEILHLETKIQSQDEKKEIIEKYTNLKSLNREIVEKLIECIYIGAKDPDTGEVPVEIHWNF